MIQNIYLTDNHNHSYLELLNNSERALFFHLPEYLSLLENHLKSKVIIFLFEIDNQSQAAIPFISKEGSHGKVLNSLPYFGSNGSFITSNDLKKSEDLIKKELMDYVYQWCKNENIVSINIVTNYFNQTEKKWFKTYFKPDYISERFGQVSSLPNYTNNYDSILLKQFHDPRPRNIRKAINSGVTIRKALNDSDWDFLYLVHKDNMEGIGAPVKNKEFFNLVKDGLSDEFYNLYIAEIDNKSVACMLVFHSFQTVEYYTPGTLSEYRNQQPSALLVFEAMKEFAKKGYKWWNWGGSSSRESGVYDFKKKWGATEMPYYHMTKIFNNNIYKSSSKDLMEQYPGFFVVPFNQLKNEEN